MSEKLCFAAQLERSRPFIISGHDVIVICNPYLDVNVQTGNISSVLPIPRYRNTESKRSAEVL